MIKVFRRLELGRNLDIEVHDALSRSLGRCGATFRLGRGSWSRDGGETQHADLAMAVEKLTDARDGWGMALTPSAEGTVSRPRRRLSARPWPRPTRPYARPSRPPTCREPRWR